MAIKVTDVILALAVDADDVDDGEFSGVRRGRKAADYSPVLRKIASDGFVVLPADVWKHKGAAVQKYAKAAGTPVTSVTSVNKDKVRVSFKELSDAAHWRR